MKRSYLVVVAAVLFISAGVSAQTKIGFLRINDIVGLMPELAQDKVNMDSVGQRFVKDSIMPTVNLKQDQYNNLLKEYTDTVKNSVQVRSVIEKELKDLQTDLSGVDNYIQQVLQEKQQEFLRPYYAKAKKAIDAVAEEKGYKYVLNTDVFLIAPEADDLSVAVLTKLGIKLPNATPKITAPKTGK